MKPDYKPALLKFGRVRRSSTDDPNGITSFSAPVSVLAEMRSEAEKNGMSLSRFILSLYEAHKEQATHESWLYADLNALEIAHGGVTSAQLKGLIGYLQHEYDEFEALKAGYEIP